MPAARLKQMDLEAQPCRIPDPKKLALHLHDGTLTRVAAWNDGAALQPGVTRLADRMANIDEQTHQHLLDKPMAVQDVHEFGSISASSAETAMPARPPESATDLCENAAERPTDQEPIIDAATNTTISVPYITAPAGQPCLVVAAPMKINVKVPDQLPIRPYPESPAVKSRPAKRLKVTCKQQEGWLDADRFTSQNKACFIYPQTSEPPVYLRASQFEKAAGSGARKPSVSIKVYVEGRPSQSYGAWQAAQE